jgi:hypothetical protein
MGSGCSTSILAVQVRQLGGAAARMILETWSIILLQCLHPTKVTNLKLHVHRCDLVNRLDKRFDRCKQKWKLLAVTSCEVFRALQLNVPMRFLQDFNLSPKHHR